MLAGLADEARGAGPPLEPDCTHFNNASSFGVNILIQGNPELKGTVVSNKNKSMENRIINVLNIFR